MLEPAVILWVLLLILLLLGLTLLAAAVHAGLFTEVVVGTGASPVPGPWRVAYRYHRGPYRGAGAAFTELMALTPSLTSFGVYYDDPRETPQSELRYIVGVILSLSESPERYEALLAAKGYNMITFPAVSHVVSTRFPFSNTLSIIIAVSRVYPKLSQYIEERKLCAHPMIEVYRSNTIHFIAPLAKQDEFYVPEACEEDTTACGDQPSRDLYETETPSREEDISEPSAESASLQQPLKSEPKAEDSVCSCESTEKTESCRPSAESLPPTSIPLHAASGVSPSSSVSPDFEKIASDDPLLPEPCVKDPSVSPGEESSASSFEELTIEPDEEEDSETESKAQQTEAT